MKKMQAFMLVIFSILLATCSSCEKITYNSESAILLQNATVFDAKSGKMNQPQDVLMNGEKII
jgi:uncharacterized protein YcfL